MKLPDNVVSIKLDGRKRFSEKVLLGGYAILEVGYGDENRIARYTKEGNFEGSRAQNITRIGQEVHIDYCSNSSAATLTFSSTFTACKFMEKLHLAIKITGRNS